MSLLLLRAADRRPVPWKNGGGVTTEVAAYPPGAGFDDFDWRISFANVDIDGPFSTFPGVDRTLVLIEGVVRLSIQGRAAVDLTSASPPYAFPGDAPAAAQLLAGPALDLNVMVRRCHLVAEVTPLFPPATLPPALGLGLLIVTQGQVRLDGALELHRFDAVLFENGSASRLDSDGSAVVYLVALREP